MKRYISYLLPLASALLAVVLVQTPPSAQVGIGTGAANGVSIAGGGGFFDANGDSRGGVITGADTGDPLTLDANVTITGSFSSGNFTSDGGLTTIDDNLAVTGTSDFTGAMVTHAAVTTGGTTTLGGHLLWTNGGAQIGLSSHTTSPSNLFLISPAITAGTGSGVTLDVAGEVRQEVYKFTVARTNVVTAGVTHDLVIATLPAKTFIQHILADVTQAFACTGTCTSSTLSATVGSSAGGNQYLVSFDIDAATAQFGDAAAELGATLTEATIPTAIGALGSWASTQAINLRITSGTGNLGTGSATNLSAGSITFYVTTIKYP